MTQNSPETSHRIDPIETETRKVQQVGLYSFFVNLGLTGLKSFFAAASGSIAIFASAVDSATDSIASLVVWGGLKVSARQSRRFPYGLHKVENLIQVMVALLIFYVGYGIARKIISPVEEMPMIHLTTIAGMGVSVLVPLLFGCYTMKVGRRTGSPALIADGRHRQADVLSSLVVFAAVISDYVGLAFYFHGITLDRLAGGLVLIFIFQAGWRLLVNGMRVLLDISMDPKHLSRIREIIQSEPMVTEIRFLCGRTAGRFRFVETEVALKSSDLKKAHEVTDRIEARVKGEVPRVIRVLIHYEPQEKDQTPMAMNGKKEGQEN
jgi:cation diffusion facilitator family transporter